jgi:phosphodiesterase/alkaline phosphatase D-like protein
MKLILVPHSAGTNDATLWLCVTDTPNPPPDFDLTIEKLRRETVRQADWQGVSLGSLKAAETQTYVQAKKLTNLSPHTPYHALAGPARASFSTLPVDVPSGNERPFTVLIASCFYTGNALAPLIGAAIEGLPQGLKPDIKILCGDQVYLDAPEITFLPLGEAALSRLFLSKYLRNWSDDGGYQVLLRTASSYFTADDHEFWNNHPNRAMHIPNTWTEGGRRRLQERALKLYQTFQCADAREAGVTRALQIGKLSFRIADTRVNRQEGEAQFMNPQDLKEITDWLQQSGGPKILVVGQPLFANPAGVLKRTFVDRVLPDYEQYKELVAAISKSRNSVVILTGDVHYSRVAAAVFQSGMETPEVTEIITSPTAVVAGAPGKPSVPPDRFPASAVTGMTAARTSSLLTGNADNNFVTLQFTQASGLINMRVQHFYIRRSANSLSVASGPAMPQPGQELNIRLF